MEDCTKSEIGDLSGAGNERQHNNYINIKREESSRNQWTRAATPVGENIGRTR